MSLAAWQDWFGDHLYRAILVLSMLEGLGIPVPAELLYLPGVHLARWGEISLPLLVSVGTLGNIVGSFTGYAVAYWGGPAFLQKVSRWFGIKPEALRRMESFFARYGQGTVFVSRFIGLIRVATIYSAGAARMSPLRFLIYLSASALVWNVAWALVVARFEHVAIRLLHGRGAARLLLGLLALVALYALGRWLVGWYRRRRPTEP